jgi:hypothetical protein
MEPAILFTIGFFRVNPWLISIFPQQKIFQTNPIDTKCHPGLRPGIQIFLSAPPPTFFFQTNPIWRAAVPQRLAAEGVAVNDRLRSTQKTKPIKPKQKPGAQVMKLLWHIMAQSA